MVRTMWEEVGNVVPDAVVLRRLLFAGVHIPKSTPGYSAIVNDFAFKAYEKKPNPDHTRVLLENLEFLSEKAFDTDKELLAELYVQEGFLGRPLGVVLIPTESTCKSCGGNLKLRADRPSYLSLYTDEMGTVPATLFRKYCSHSHKGCTFTQHYGFHCFNDKESSETVADSNWDELPYFVSTSKTGFSLSFLKRFDSELLLGQLSYKQKCDIYNYFHKYETTRKTISKDRKTSHESDEDPEYDLQSLRGADTSEGVCARACLDRRRLEEAHLKYCILRMYQRYPSHFSTWSIASSLKQTFEAVTLTFYQAFSAYFADHRCNYAGCSEVLVLDGNLKNRRDVCAATEAGFIQYPSLPGSIKTGCQLSPLQTSSYCFYHAPRVSKRSTDSDSGDERADPSYHEGVVKVIVGKKTTRNTTYYQVAWVGYGQEISWEPASTVPQSLITEFEAGISSRQETLSTEPKYGVITHTLVTSADPTHSDEPPEKRKRIELPNMEEGVFKDGKDDCGPLTCNTEKDKDFHLHRRSAGVLAGMWPCGIVVMLTELFTAESKSQVYAALHELLSNHATIASNLRNSYDYPISLFKLEFVCYDDGCHLRRYATNPSRRNLTPQSIQLANTKIVVDKLHMAGHIDTWCRQHCDPRSFKELDNVDTEVCEQHFSWLSKYARMTRRMSRNMFLFFILHIVDMHNRREECKLRRGGFACLT